MADTDDRFHVKHREPSRPQHLRRIDMGTGLPRVSHHHPRPSSVHKVPACRAHRSAGTHGADRDSVAPLNRARARRGAASNKKRNSIGLHATNRANASTHEYYPTEVHELASTLSVRPLTFRLKAYETSPNCHATHQGSTWHHSTAYETNGVERERSFSPAAPGYPEIVDVPWCQKTHGGSAHSATADRRRPEPDCVLPGWMAAFDEEQREEQAHCCTDGRRFLIITKRHPRRSMWHFPRSRNDRQTCHAAPWGH